MPCFVAKFLTRLLPKNVSNKHYTTENRKKCKKKKSYRYFSLQNNDALEIFVNNLIHKIFIIIVCGVALFHKSEGSLVLDRAGEDNLLFTNYCPSSKYCPEGSHVMCMFYNPRSKYGPECIDPANSTIDLQKANWLLDIFNAMRSKVARGEETGKDGVRLPRAFGLIRLQWDSELATFAQILADQCTENLYDQCRATRKFPKPYQFILGVQDRVDRWYRDKLPIAKPWQSGQKLNEDKINEAITMIFRHAYTMKNSITPDNIVNPSKIKNHYLNFVGSASTHIGCAYILFSRYHPYNINIFEKMIQLICNLSGSLDDDSPVYRTKPPGNDEPGITKKCGCPEGYAEDSGCLCYLIDSHKVDCHDDPKCRPPVVVLPIVTFEEAPPSHWTENSVNSSEVNLRTHKNLIKRHYDIVPTTPMRLVGKSTISNSQKADVIKRKNKPGRRPKFEIPVQRRHVVYKYRNTPNIDTYENTRSLESYTEFPHYKTEDVISKRYRSTPVTVNSTNKKMRDEQQDNRNNLINLLNKLEQEVNHINLDVVAKTLLDTKIMAIYEKLLKSDEAVHKPTVVTTKLNVPKILSNEEFNSYNDDNADTVLIIPRHDYTGGPVIRELIANKQSSTKPLANNEREYAISSLRNQKSFHSGVNTLPFENISLVQKADKHFNNNASVYLSENSLRKFSYNDDHPNLVRKPTFRRADPYSRVGREEPAAKKKLYVKTFNHDDDDFLSTERRKYYQDKLDKVKIKFENEQMLPKEFEADRPVRRVRPAYINKHARKKSNDESDRAVVLHGF